MFNLKTETSKELVSLSFSCTQCDSISHDTNDSDDVTWVMLMGKPHGVGITTQ